MSARPALTPATVISTSSITRGLEISTSSMTWWWPLTERDPGVVDHWVARSIAL